MIECSELTGKIIRGCTIYEQNDNAAEVVLEFTDNTTFSVCLKSSVSVDARSIRDEGGEPQVLKIFTGPPASH